jgi:hypothetical protein
MATISDTTGKLTGTGKRTVDLSKMVEKPSGAWPRGWYPFEVVEGYTAGTHQFLTDVTLARAGDSFNFRLCVRMTNGEQVRTNFRNINYKPSDFEPETIQRIENLRQEFAGQRGWPGFKDDQRASLTLSQLGQLADATGVPIAFNDDGTISIVDFVGAKGFVRLNINEKTGYNDITAFSQYAGGVEPRKRTR